jgi:hypothetical protein
LPADESPHAATSTPVAATKIPAALRMRGIMSPDAARRYDNLPSRGK